MGRKKSDHTLYVLTILENSDYWSLIKYNVDYNFCNNEGGKEMCIYSSRGRASIGINNSGEIKVYTARGFVTYISKEEMNTLLIDKSVVKRIQSGDLKTFYTSKDIDKLIPLIPNIDQDIKNSIELIRKIKIQHTHKIS